ncbi:uncharacterized protein LOC109202448 [Oreochromis niloticus]|uniref:uncharacterized protein LOC109202448 n=1 Tax=Oreochromis niloticus TaxID=8128 RepID=UPI000DF40A48|nr:uncharacterized protein LOC109202448 [Oreochromis niloticus]
MKNAKEICKKYAPKNYHLAMHTVGVFTTATSLKDLSDMVQSAAVVFGSPCSGENVEKHFHNLQLWMQKANVDVDGNARNSKADEDLKGVKGNNLFGRHFKELISNTSLEMDGDLGRHGTGKMYEQYHNKYNALRKIKRQNITENNKMQGIMEKSQWDLKHIRLRSGRLTRLDDFVVQYQISHTALLKEYEVSKRMLQRKKFRVDEEKWKERRQKKKGRYVTVLRKPFPFRRSTKMVASSMAPSSPVQTGRVEDVTLETPEFQEVLSLWKKRDTEVVVSVLPSKNHGTSIIIHHSDLRTLRPHLWLTGEVIEGLFHCLAKKEQKGIYIMNHYTAGLILFGDRTQLSRQSLRNVNFDRYQAIVMFVNIKNVHWKFLFINAVNHTVYLLDPAPSSSEEEDSKLAARKFSDYLKMRRTRHAKTEWVDIKWKGGVLTHPVQKDGFSCGVLVVMMARAVMKVFPDFPVMKFKTSKEKMAEERKLMALEILQASVFDTNSNCAM